MGQFNTIPPNPFPPSSENAGGGGEPYLLPVASADTLGGVKVGNNLSIDESGVLSAPAPYELPTATDEALGGVMIDGAGLAVDENGLLSVNAGDGLHTNVLGELCADGFAYSTTEQVVGTWIDGTPVYEKTVTITLGGTSDTDTLVLDGIIPNAAWIVSSDFVSVQGNEKLHFFLGCRVGGVMTTGFLLSKSDGLYLRTNNNYAGVSGLSGYVTIRYVKPTV